VAPVYISEYIAEAKSLEAVPWLSHSQHSHPVQDGHFSRCLWNPTRTTQHTDRMPDSPMTHDVNLKDSKLEIIGHDQINITYPDQTVILCAPNACLTIWSTHPTFHIIFGSEIHIVGPFVCIFTVFRRSGASQWSGKLYFIPPKA
jgi:hypothetical protein